MHQSEYLAQPRDVTDDGTRHGRVRLEEVSDLSAAMKSTAGNLIYFGGALIAWSSNRQPVIAQSSAECEQVAAFETVV